MPDPLRPRVEPEDAAEVEGDGGVTLS